MDRVIPAATRQARPRTRRRAGLWLLREPLRRRTWAELRYVVVSLPVAIGGFVLAVITSVFGVVSFALLAGPPLIALSSTCARGLAAVSRGLAGRLLGTRVAPPPPFRPLPGVTVRLWSGITDAASWRARAYLVLKLPVAVVGYLVAGWAGVGGVSGLTYPLRWAILALMHVHGEAGAVRPISSLPALEGNLLVVPSAWHYCSPCRG